jgi:hypothetical protein
VVVDGVSFGYIYLLLLPLFLDVYLKVIAFGENEVSWIEERLDVSSVRGLYISIATCGGPQAMIVSWSRRIFARLAKITNIIEAMA